MATLQSFSKKEIRLFDYLRDAYRTASIFKLNGPLGDSSISNTIERCDEQMQGVWDPETQSKLKEQGLTSLYVNLTRLKVSALEAWIRDILNPVLSMPFAYEPTPIHNLSEKTKDDLANELIRQLATMQEQIQDESQLLELVANIKNEHNKKEEMFVRKRLDNMTKLIADQLADSNFKDEFIVLLHNLCTYPYAVIEGSIPEEEYQFEWKNNKLSQKRKVVGKFHAVHPNDFLFSSDSKTTQDGSYCIIRKTFTLNQLHAMLNNKSYIKSGVKACIEQIEEDQKFGTGLHNYFGWIINPMLSDYSTLTHSINIDSLPGLKFYGKVPGELLKGFGLSGIEEKLVYETTITVVGQAIVKVHVDINSNILGRPIFATSYQKDGKGFIGTAIPQLIRDTEKLYHSQLRSLVLNSAFSAGVQGEVDVSRIQEYADEENMGQLIPNSLSYVSPNMYGGGQPAYYFHTVPNITAAMLRAMDYFKNQADVITQIPAMVHGQPVGTGANRTFRGMSMLYGNALKGIQAGIMNLDNDILQPLAKRLYYVNMLDKDVPEDCKSDAQIVALGTAGLINKEMSKQENIENLQLLMQLQGTGAVPGGIMATAIKELLLSLGYSAEDVDAPLPPKQPDNAAPASQSQQVEPQEQNSDENPSY